VRHVFTLGLGPAAFRNRKRNPGSYSRPLRALRGTSQQFEMRGVGHSRAGRDLTESAEEVSSKKLAQLT